MILLFKNDNVLLKKQFNNESRTITLLLGKLEKEFGIGYRLMTI